MVGALQVEQLGEAKILWLTQRFRTLLKVTEDARDPKKLVTTFALIRSVGSWRLTNTASWNILNHGVERG
jgi:hypothetical protein